jgi:hypothetical protein
MPNFQEKTPSDQGVASCEAKFLGDNACALPCVIARTTRGPRDGDRNESHSDCTDLTMLCHYCHVRAVGRYSGTCLRRLKAPIRLSTPMAARDSVPGSGTELPATLRVSDSE